MKKEYVKGDLTVVWKPDLCIHAGECVKRLPDVYKPGEKPWIQLGDANQEALIRQINACPSGALTYYLNKDKIDHPEIAGASVTVMENGPLVMKGEIRLTGIDGEEKVIQKSTAFCRCGASSNKPYCDGTHRDTHFRG